jgi:hypothetical protein
MSRSCQKSFCYICGEVVLKSTGKPLPQLVRKASELYFGLKAGDQDKIWAPKIAAAHVQGLWQAG